MDQKTYNKIFQQTERLTAHSAHTAHNATTSSHTLSTHATRDDWHYLTPNISLNSYARFLLGRCESDLPFFSSGLSVHGAVVRRGGGGSGLLCGGLEFARELVLAQSDAEAPLDEAALDDGRRVQGDALDELSDGFEAEIAGIVEGVAEHIRRRLESLGEFGEELATDPVLGLSIITGGQGHDLACERSWPSDASDAGSDASGVDDEDGLTPFSSTPAPTGARAS